MPKTEPLNLDELRELYEQTTQGKWERDPYDKPDMQVIAVGNEVVAYHNEHRRQVDIHVVPNFKFIAAAHNAMPVLLATLAEKEAEKHAANRLAEHAMSETLSLRAELQHANERTTKYSQALGWLLDAADAAYNEDDSNERIHEIFNIAAQATGITRRLPDEHSPLEL